MWLGRGFGIGPHRQRSGQTVRRKGWRKKNQTSWRVRTVRMAAGHSVSRLQRSDGRFASPFVKQTRGAGGKKKKRKRKRKRATCRSIKLPHCHTATSRKQASRITRRVLCHTPQLQPPVFSISLFPSDVFILPYSPVLLKEIP